MISPFSLNVQCTFERLVRSSTRTLFFQIGGQSFTILLDCEESILHYRLSKRGKESERIDDNLVAIGKKLTFFKNYTLPIMKTFEDDGKLVVVSCGHVFLIWLLVLLLGCFICFLFHFYELWRYIFQSSEPLKTKFSQYVLIVNLDAFEVARMFFLHVVFKFTSL